MKKILVLLLLTIILLGCGRADNADLQQGEKIVTDFGQEADGKNNTEDEGSQGTEYGQAEETGNNQETVISSEQNTGVKGELKVSGSMILEDENALYLCSPYMLTKVDKETGEAETLWESDKRRIRSAEYTYSGGRGVLIGDIIYFIEEWMDESAENHGGTKKALNMIGTDGTGYRRLVENNITDLFAEKGILYLQISEIEVYLMGYPIAEDGSLITEALIKDTKESRGIPDTYTLVNYFCADGRKMLTPKESLEEFGYYLLRNDTYEFVRIFEDTGEEELVAEAFSEAYLRSFNDQYFLISHYEEDKNVYYLIDRQTLERKPFMDAGWNEEIIAMDEAFVYLRRGNETADKITEYFYERVDLKTGEVTLLFSQEPFVGLKTDPSSYLADTVLKNGYIYYVDMKDYKLYMMRRSLENPMVEEVLGEAFFDSGISTVGATAYEYAEFFGDGTERRVSSERNEVQEEYYGELSEEKKEEPCATVDLEWLIVDEKYPGAALINDCMKETMDVSIGYEREAAQEVTSYRAEFDADFPAYSISSYIHEVSYIDDTYLSFCQAYYEYTGGAHGMPYRVGYTFNLQTGELLTLGDVIGNTEEELREIVGRYFEELISKDPELYWEGSVEGIKEWTSFDSFFYLTEEGIRFYEEPYSISSYAAGFQEVTIPYSEFVMKIPVGEEINRGAVQIPEADLNAFAVQMAEEEKRAFEAYYPVFKEGKEYVLCDGWEDEEECLPEAAAVIDLDADGMQEVILRFAPFGDYLILHKEGEEFYGLKLVFRGFLMPKQDGTYIASGGASCNLYNKLYFEDNKFYQELLAEQADYETFYIAGERVSQQEFDDFIEGLDIDRKEDIVFYERKE